MTRVGTPVRDPNTPGIAGYVLGAAVSFFACAVLLVLPGVLFLGDVLVAVVYVPFAAIMVGVYGAPVAVVGALVVQLLCWKVEQQAVHVGVAAFVGWALALAWCRVTDVAELGPDVAWAAIAVGVAAGAGRAAVIPLVRSRRRLAAVGHLSGTARW